MVRKLCFNLDNTSIIDESTVLNLINDILTVLEQFYRVLDKSKLSSHKDIFNMFLRQVIFEASLFITYNVCTVYTVYIYTQYK